MKHIFSRIVASLAIIMVAVATNAQDVIVTTDNQKIEAKILEVSESEIRYKESNYLEGPTFVLKTERISSITYGNGKEVVYSGSKEKEAEAIAKANAMGNLFGKTNGSNTSGDGAKGQPIGHGSAGSNSWSMAGRGIKGTLPQPANDFRQEGRVVVEVRVNEAGKVIDAKRVGGTITDKYTIQLALDAARKVRFTAGAGEQIGTITYTFKFN